MAKKKKSIFIRIISTLLSIVLVVSILAVGGYFYLKNNLGIDIFDLKNKIELLNRPASESKIITNGYSNEDISSAFLEITGSSNIYTLNAQNKYVFNKEAYEASSLQVSCTLTDKEFAGLVSTIIKNYSFSQLDIDDKFKDLLEIKEITFTSLTDELTHKKVEFSYVVCVDLQSIKKDIENMEFISLINKYIPSKIFLKSNCVVELDESNSKAYSITSSTFNINELNEEESKKVLNLFDFVDNGEFSQEMVTEINSLICNFLFGDNDYNGILNSINGSSGFEFTLSGEKVVLSIKK